MYIFSEKHMNYNIYGSVTFALIKYCPIIKFCILKYNICIHFLNCGCDSFLRHSPRSTVNLSYVLWSFWLRTLLSNDGVCVCVKGLTFTILPWGPGRNRSSVTLVCRWSLPLISMYNTTNIPHCSNTISMDRKLAALYLQWWRLCLSEISPRLRN